MKALLIITIAIFSISISAQADVTGPDYLVPRFWQPKTWQQVNIAQTNQPPKQVTHRKTLWTSGSISLEVIDGHHYIVTCIRSSGYGSYGITSVTHAESCPCKQQKEKKEELKKSPGA